ncbi:MAG: sigma-54-dependent Fis family transcriptional regulator [Deferrisomatales bacterium]
MPRATPSEPSDTETRRFVDSVVNYLDILRVLDEGVIITDQAGVIRFYNRAQARIDGVDPAYPVGKKATEVYDLTDETSLIMRCLHSQTPLVDRHLLYKTSLGRIVNSICSVYPLFNDQGLVGAVCFVRDYNLVENTITSICSRSVPDSGAPAGNGTRYGFSDLIGESPVFQGTVKTAKMAALTPSPVMIYGETGTGKELFAQSIHNYGPRKDKPYVAINCAAIPEHLLEGILFGTVKGAFTGAVDKPGLVEKAGGGTLFLDEVNSMPLGLQAKLLRVIQEKRVRRVGALEEKVVDLKVISSVNEDPHAAIEQGRLRLDLFYRLGVVLLRIPPLRERREDIPLLVQAFIDRLDRELGRQVEGVSDRVLETFSRHSWPGNVRELEHTIEGAMNVVGERRVIEVEDLPAYLSTGGVPSGVPVRREPEEPSRLPTAAPAAPRAGRGDGADRRGGLLQEQAQRERASIVEALTRTRGNVSRAAVALGISRQLLHYKMNKYGIARQDFVGGP